MSSENNMPCPAIDLICADYLPFGFHPIYQQQRTLKETTNFLTDMGSVNCRKIFEMFGENIKMFKNSKELEDSLIAYQEFPGSHLYFEYLPTEPYCRFFEEENIITHSGRKLVRKFDVYKNLQDGLVRCFPQMNRFMNAIIAILLKTHESGHGHEFVYDENLDKDINATVRDFCEKADKIEQFEFRSYTEESFLEHVQEILSAVVWKGHTDTYLIFKDFLYDFCYVQQEQRDFQSKLNYLVYDLKSIVAFLASWQKKIENLAGPKHVIQIICDDGRRYVLKEEVMAAKGSFQSERILRILSEEEAEIQEGDFEVIETELIRTKLSAQPILTSTGRFCRFANDVRVQILQGLFFGYRVVQKIEKDEWKIIKIFFDEIREFFDPEEEPIYFLEKADIRKIEQAMQQHFGYLESRPANDIRIPKKLTVESVKKELVYLGITEIFPDSVTYADELADRNLEPNDIFYAMDYCLMECLYKRIPDVEKFDKDPAPPPLTKRFSKTCWKNVELSENKKVVKMCCQKCHSNQLNDTISGYPNCVVLRTFTSCVFNQSEDRRVFTTQVIEKIPLLLEKQGDSVDQEKLEKFRDTDENATMNLTQLKEILEEFDVNKELLMLVPDDVYSYSSLVTMKTRPGFPIAILPNPSGKMVMHSSMAQFHIFQSVVCDVNWKKEVLQEPENSKEHFKAMVIEEMKKLDGDGVVTVETVEGVIEKLKEHPNYKERKERKLLSSLVKLFNADFNYTVPLLFFYNECNDSGIYCQLPSDLDATTEHLKIWHMPAWKARLLLLNAWIGMFFAGAEEDDLERRVQMGLLHKTPIFDWKMDTDFADLIFIDKSSRRLDLQVTMKVYAHVSTDPELDKPVHSWFKDLAEQESVMQWGKSSSVDVHELIDGYDRKSCAEKMHVVRKLIGSQTGIKRWINQVMRAEDLKFYGEEHTTEDVMKIKKLRKILFYERVELKKYTEENDGEDKSSSGKDLKDIPGPSSVKAAEEVAELRGSSQGTDKENSAAPEEPAQKSKSWMKRQKQKEKKRAKAALQDQNPNDEHQNELAESESSSSDRQDLPDTSRDTDENATMNLTQLKEVLEEIDVNKEVLMLAPDEALPSSSATLEVVTNGNLNKPKISEHPHQNKRQEKKKGKNSGKAESLNAPAPPNPAIDPRESDRCDSCGRMSQRCKQWTDDLTYALNKIEKTEKKMRKMEREAVAAIEVKQKEMDEERARFKKELAEQREQHQKTLDEMDALRRQLEAVQLSKDHLAQQKEVVEAERADVEATSTYQHQVIQLLRHQLSRETLVGLDIRQSPEVRRILISLQDKQNKIKSGMAIRSANQKVFDFKKLTKDPYLHGFAEYELSKFYTDSTAYDKAVIENVKLIQSTPLITPAELQEVPAEPDFSLKFHKKFIELQNEAIESQCAICWVLPGVEGPTAWTKCDGCRKKFHKECIKNWFKINNTGICAHCSLVTNIQL